MRLHQSLVVMLLAVCLGGCVTNSALGPQVKSGNGPVTLVVKANPAITEALIKQRAEEQIRQFWSPSQVKTLRIGQRLVEAQDFGRMAGILSQTRFRTVSWIVEAEGDFFGTFQLGGLDSPVHRYYVRQLVMLFARDTGALTLALNVTPPGTMPLAAIQAKFAQYGVPTPPIIMP
jgi:hypothetical protein